MARGSAKEAPAVPPDADRCKRSDGKSWRCKNPRLAESTYCEAHQRRAKAGARVSAPPGQKGVASAAAKGKRGSGKDAILKPIQGASAAAERSSCKVYERRAKGALSTPGRQVLESSVGSLHESKNRVDSWNKPEDHTTLRSLMSARALRRHSPMTVKNVKVQKESIQRVDATMAGKLDIKIEADFSQGDEFYKERIMVTGKDVKRKDFHNVYSRKKRLKGGMNLGGKENRPCADGVLDVRVKERTPSEKHAVPDAGVKESVPRKDAYLDMGFKENARNKVSVLDSGVKENNLAKEIVVYVMGVEEKVPDKEAVFSVRVKENVQGNYVHNKNLDMAVNENGPNEDVTAAPFSSPSSPNIGESFHQVSQALHSVNDPSAPSASTSSMAGKKQEPVGNTTLGVMLEDQETGRIRKNQRTKRPPKSTDEFSVSRCAAVLNEMTGFAPQELVKASRIFIKPFNREIFLSFNDELRREWLRDQISE